MYACIYCDPDFSCTRTDIQPGVVQEVLADLKKRIKRLKRKELEKECHLEGDSVSRRHNREVDGSRREHEAISSLRKIVKRILSLTFQQRVVISTFRVVSSLALHSAKTSRFPSMMLIAGSKNKAYGCIFRFFYHNGEVFRTHLCRRG